MDLIGGVQGVFPIGAKVHAVVKQHKVRKEVCPRCNGSAYDMEDGVRYFCPKC